MTESVNKCSNLVQFQLDSKTILNSASKLKAIKLNKHKPTNVGRIALKRQADGKTFDPPGFDPLTSRWITLCTTDCAIWPLIWYAATNFILATSFTPEREQKWSLKNEERKCEKVTWEVKECSRRKALKGQAKNLYKKTPVYNNCYELRSKQLTMSASDHSNKLW